MNRKKKKPEVPRSLTKEEKHKQTLSPMEPKMAGTLLVSVFVWQNRGKSLKYEGASPREKARATLGRS